MVKKYIKKNIFPYGEVLVPTDRVEYTIYDETIPKDIIKYKEPNPHLFDEKEFEPGWLTKAIIDKLTKKSQAKKQKEIELLRLDIEIAELKKKLEKVKK
jgi:hypothetical protein